MQAREKLSILSAWFAYQSQVQFPGIHDWSPKHCWNKLQVLSCKYYLITALYSSKVNDKNVNILKILKWHSYDGVLVWIKMQSTISCIYEPTSHLLWLLIFKMYPAQSIWTWFLFHTFHSLSEGILPVCIKYNWEKKVRRMLFFIWRWVINENKYSHYFPDSLQSMPTLIHW